MADKKCNCYNIQYLKTFLTFNAHIEGRVQTVTALYYVCGIHKIARFTKTTYINEGTE